MDKTEPFCVVVISLVRIRPLSGVDVPFEMSLSQQFLHGIPSLALTVELALPHARPIAQDIPLVLCRAGTANVSVTLRHALFQLLFFSCSEMKEGRIPPA